MKIAHLTTHLNMGGIPVYIYTLAKALQNQGIEQIVISSGGSMEPDFIKSNLAFFCFNLKTKFEFHPKLFLALSKIIKLLKSEKVDLIHAHTRVGQVLAAIIQKQAGIPYVSTCHGIYQPRLSRKIFPAWGQKVIAISEPVKQNLIHMHGIDQKRVTRIRNGIEIERFVSAADQIFKENSRAHFLFNTTDFVLCMVARLVSPKGAEDFIDAIQILSKQHANIRGIIVGDGPAKPKFEKKVADLGFADKIKFTGSISDVTPVLATSDVFIHPIRVVEGFGLSIAEAMAAALPVIVTDQWALIHLMQSRDIGEFVPVQSPHKIAEVVEKWLQTPEKLKEMGKNAQAAAIEFFDIKRMAREVSAVYAEVLNCNAHS